MNLHRTVLAVLVGLLGAGLTTGQDASTYLPLQVGGKWHYRCGDYTVVVEVQRTETIKIKTMTPKGEEEVSVTTYRLKSTSGDNELTESIGVTKDGIYRFAAAGKEIVPPLKLLHLPVEVNMKWQVDSVSEKTSLKGTFALRQETVKVPAGAFNAGVAACLDFQIGPQKLEVEYWFVPERGIVKQRTKLGAGKDVVLELEKYEPGK